MKDVLLVLVGSGIGGVLRYLTACGLKNVGISFPLGTFAANLCGCLLIGLFSALALKGTVSADTKLLLTTGLCGGFTTFSTFMNENLSMLRSGDVLQFALYTAFSIALGIVMVWLGMAIAEKV